MKTWAALLAVASLAALLAGCFDPAPAAPSPDSLLAGVEDLRPDGYYAFQHTGGGLVFAVPSNGSAEVVLYGADDRRVGHIGLGADEASGRFVLDGLQPGELVVQVLALNGTLDVRSDGQPVTAFRPLARHVERHVLLDQPGSAPVFLPQQGNDVDRTENVTLLRTPAALRLVAHGTYQDLQVSVTGRQGLVYQSDSSNGFLLVPSPQGFYGVVSGKTYDENIRDGDLVAHVRSGAFQGTLLLEADGYSRAAVVGGDAHATRDHHGFTYGALPDQPVAFEVRAGAKELYLWHEEGKATQRCPSPQSDLCGNQTGTLVALFGPHDERVATVQVPDNGTLAVPVSQPGKWVAVLVHGAATLGADLAPGDFDLHPLDTQQVTTPSRDSAWEGGGNGSYGQKREPLQTVGVPFHVEMVYEYPAGGLLVVPNDTFTGCSESTVSLLRGGETVGAWGYAGVGSPTWDPDLYLAGPGDLEVEHADYQGCERAALTVTGYQRG